MRKVKVAGNARISENCWTANAGKRYKQRQPSLLFVQYDLPRREINVALVFEICERHGSRSDRIYARMGGGIIRLPALTLCIDALAGEKNYGADKVDHALVCREVSWR